MLHRIETELVASHKKYSTLEKDFLKIAKENEVLKTKLLDTEKRSAFWLTHQMNQQSMTNAYQAGG